MWSQEELRCISVCGCEPTQTLDVVNQGVAEWVQYLWLRRNTPRRTRAE